MEAFVASPLAIEIFVALLFSVVIYIIAKKWSEHTINALSGCLNELKTEIETSNKVNNEILVELKDHNRRSKETTDALKKLQEESIHQRRDHEAMVKSLEKLLEK